MENNKQLDEIATYNLKCNEIDIPLKSDNKN